MKKLISSICLVLMVVCFNTQAFPHCQVPCGIYNDAARIAHIKEDIKTIEKAMIKINEFSAQDEKNYNQIIRWVNTKEKHAQNIDEIVSAYFLTQKIKPVSPTDEAAFMVYKNKLILLHNMLFYSMKAKQNTDTKYTDKLKEILEEFKTVYF